MNLNILGGMAGGWRFFSMRGFKKLIIIQAAMQNSLRLKGGGAAIWDKILWAWVFNASTEKETESKSSFQSLESVKNHYCCIVWHWSWFESVKNVKSPVWPLLSPRVSDCLSHTCCCLELMQASDWPILSPFWLLIGLHKSCQKRTLTHLSYLMSDNYY